MRPLVLFLVAVAASAQPDGGPLAPVHADLAPGLSLHLVPAPADAATAATCNTWYGTDGEPPATVLAEAWVERDGRRLDLDASCMTTCAECGWEGFTSRPLEGTDDWEVGGGFSDGAGTSDVAWRVGRVGTVRTRLVSGPEIFDDAAAERQRGIRDRLDALAEGLAALRDETSDTAVSAQAGELYEILVDLAALLQDE